MITVQELIDYLAGQDPDAIVGVNLSDDSYYDGPSISSDNLVTVPPVFPGRVTLHGNYRS